VSFKKQKTRYSCGAASLKYALTFLGQTVGEKEILKASRTTTRGIDETGIIRAARRYGCVAVERSFRSFPVAYRHLIRYVQSGQPCILCVDSWKHWVTAAGGSRKGLALFDPGSPKVAVLLQSSRLRTRWRFLDRERGKEHYYFLAVRPVNGARKAPRVTAGIDKEIVRSLRRNDELRQNWNQYLLDLTDMFGDCLSRTHAGVPAWQFIRRNAELLADLVCFWDGGLPKTFYRREIDHLIAVARAHGFRINPRKEKEVLISLACVLSHQTPAV
jgi:hypothetical protein